jgi:uncharacterized protein (DUF983 family)
VTLPPEAPASAGATSISPLLIALRGLCPRCGSKTLFRSLTGFAPACRTCGLDLAAFNVGDGPAAFLILIIGAVIVGLAVTIDLKFSPPWWVHVLLWLPLTTASVIGALRVAKGLLLALEYKNRAAEGRIAEGQ